jgi:anti-sigma B factor antagonist
MIITLQLPDGQPVQCPGCQHELASAPADSSQLPLCPACGQAVASGHPCAVITVRLPESQMINGDKWQELESQLRAIIAEQVPPRILLDMQDVRLLSSTAFSGLLSLDRRIRNAGGQMALCHVQPQVVEVFRITRLNLVIDIQADRQAGLAVFAAI